MKEHIHFPKWGTSVGLCRHLESILDNWLREVVSRGYKLKFPSLLPSMLLLQITWARDSLAAKRFQGFYTNLFTVPNPKEGIWPILDLKDLNYLTLVQNLYMESIRSVLASFHQGDFLASVDINHTTVSSIPSVHQGVGISASLTTPQGYSYLLNTWTISY